MLTITTPRLILASTPLPVIEQRLREDDFEADVPIVVDDGGLERIKILCVRFPPEWPGDALALFPEWAARLDADPTDEIVGGTMIDRADLVAVGQMSFSGRFGDLELGYGVNPSYRGRGYATEMACALIAWALEQPGTATIMSACLEDNIASIRVLEKAGFRRAGRRIDADGPLIVWEYATKHGRAGPSR
jgi:RimJ/RimL family protein N-acetyltransferase